ncbi:MAG: Hsp33 family molecular chaperone HslO [Chloroflexota bacterium]
MSDSMILGLAKDAGLRGYVCVTTETVQEGANRHGTAPTATYTLGKALTAAALMSGLLKVSQRVALRWEGNGPLGKTLVEADSNGRIRGFTQNPDVDLRTPDGGYDIVSAIGQAGLLTVVKDLGLPELSEGTVHLVESDIDSDLTYYMDQSEQIPTIIQTFVTLDEAGQVTLAGGLLMQPLPPYEPDIIETMRDRLQELPPLEELLKRDMNPQTLLQEVMAGTSPEFISKYTVRFECTCSWERSRQLLAALGKEELESILETEGEAEVECHYCHKTYTFGSEDLEAIIAEL